MGIWDVNFKYKIGERVVTKDEKITGTIEDYRIRHGDKSYEIRVGSKILIIPETEIKPYKPDLTISISINPVPDFTKLK